MAASELKSRLLEHLEQAAEMLLGPPTSRAPDAFRWGNRGSLWLGLAGHKRGRFADHETGDGGDVIDLIRYARGCNTKQALQWANDFLDGCPATVRPRQVWRPVAKPEARIAVASRLWIKSCDFRGSPAETYLKHRGITRYDRIECIRWNSECPVGKATLPAMICAMRDINGDQLKGVHRTFITPDGLSKVDQTLFRIPSGKMMLGVAKNSAIKLTSDDLVQDSLNICEGIETGLSVYQAGFEPVWVTPSAGHLATFPVLASVTNLTIFADNDPTGTGQDAAYTCAKRWAEAGATVRIAQPKVSGCDFNDIWRFQ